MSKDNKIEIIKEDVSCLNKKLDESYVTEIDQEIITDGESVLTPSPLGTGDNELEAWHFLFW